jgi:glycosyltransferase involved in cell wall biosynthesis
VDYKSYYAQESDKKYDSIYVANTSHIKRVVRYLKAVKEISKNSDPDYKGCLVCASWGGKQEVISSLPKYFNVEKNIEIYFSLDREALNKIINSCKVNILLSYKEGSNKSLFESMFANIPVLCISENIGVNKCYINEYTGLLISDRFLEDGLLYMKEQWSKYRPKEWAVANISPEKTTEKLLAILQAREGVATSDDVYLKTNNPEVSYLNYPSINFTDINKEVLEVFEIKTSLATDSYSKEIEVIANCQNEFIKRITLVDNATTGG